MCVGSRVHLVGVSISFEKNFYRLPFTPPSLVRHFGPSMGNSSLLKGEDRLFFVVLEEKEAEVVELTLHSFVGDIW
jgi:hypothetical protein